MLEHRPMGLEGGGQMHGQSIDEILDRDQAAQVHRYQKMWAILERVFDQARFAHAPLAHQNDAPLSLRRLQNLRFEGRTGAKGSTRYQNLAVDKGIWYRGRWHPSAF